MPQSARTIYFTDVLTAPQMNNDKCSMLRLRLTQKGPHLANCNQTISALNISAPAGNCRQLQYEIFDQGLLGCINIGSLRFVRPVDARIWCDNGKTGSLC